jgi:hypothetical protein
MGSMVDNYFFNPSFQDLPLDKNRFISDEKIGSLK